MEKILVVEDSKTLAAIITKEISDKLHQKVVIASSLKETLQLLEVHTFMCAILDLHLPDAPDGEVVDVVLEKNIPVIVLTGTIEDNTRDTIIAKNVTDYVIKAGLNSIEQVIKVIKRIINNKKTSILVVDDSNLSRNFIKTLMERQMYTVHEAENGEEALAVLKTYPEISVVITDYTMPKMDGFELVKRIREEYSMDKMAVVGVSAQGNPLLSAKFLKMGANDFISKPFSEEEFYWRINQNVEILSFIDKLSNAATHDYLTGLYNRRHLYDIGETLFQNAKRNNLTLSVAVVDIDFFKKINDTYSHEMGDEVLRQVSSVLTQAFRASDIVARIGGEEFCVIVSNGKKESIFTLFDSVRKKISDLVISLHGKTVEKVTISIGVKVEILDTLEETINAADSLLYNAKESGRNQVQIG